MVRRETRPLLERAERVPGEVVAITEGRGAKGTPLHFAIVRHRPVDGDDASFWTLWFLPGVMALLGVGGLVAGRSTWAEAT
jgi:hypothetical protein